MQGVSIDRLWFFYLDFQEGSAIHWAPLCCGNIILYKTFVFALKTSEYYENHGYLEKKKYYSHIFLIYLN